MKTFSPSALEEVTCQLHAAAALLPGVELAVLGG